MDEEHAHRVGFYVVWYVRSCQLWRICHPVLESTCGTSIELDPSLDLVGSLQYIWHRFLKGYLLNSRYPTELRCQLIPRRNCRIVCGLLQHILGSDICLLPWRRYKDPGNCLSPAYISNWLFGKSRLLARMFPAIMPCPTTLSDLQSLGTHGLSFEASLRRSLIILCNTFWHLPPQFSLHHIKIMLSKWKDYDVDHRAVKAAKLYLLCACSPDPNCLCSLPPWEQKGTPRRSLVIGHCRCRFAGLWIIWVPHPYPVLPWQRRRRWPCCLWQPHRMQQDSLSHLYLWIYPLPPSPGMAVHDDIADDADDGSQCIGGWRHDGHMSTLILFGSW